jgi:hypothetical protein
MKRIPIILFLWLLLCLTTQGQNYHGNFVGVIDQNRLHYNTNITDQKYNAETFGAVHRGRILSDGVTQSGHNTLTSASASFTQADVGNPVGIDLGLDGTNCFVTTIQGVTSANAAILAAPVPNGVNGGLVVYGPDDTGPIQNLMNTVALNGQGGGVIQFPSGVYIIAGALQDVGTPVNIHHNAQLYFPALSLNNTPSVTVKIQGPTPPNGDDVPYLGGAGATFYFLNSNTNWGRCLEAGLNPASGNVQGCYSNVYFNAINVSAENLTFRTFVNQNRYVVDLSAAEGGCVVKDITINQGYYPQFIPSNVWQYSAGFVCPGVGESSKVSAEGVYVLGYYGGIIPNEHTYLVRPVVGSCTFGIYFYNVGGHMVDIEHYDCEENYWPIGMPTNVQYCPQRFICTMTTENSFPSFWAYHNGLVYDPFNDFGSSIVYYDNTTGFTPLTNQGAVNVETVFINENQTPYYNGLFGSNLNFLTIEASNEVLTSYQDAAKLTLVQPVSTNVNDIQFNTGTNVLQVGHSGYISSNTFFVRFNQYLAFYIDGIADVFNFTNWPMYGNGLGLTNIPGSGLQSPVTALFSNTVNAQTVFNVLNYGGVGDGVTDNSLAISNMLIACSNAGGGICLFPGPSTNAVNGGPAVYVSDYPMYIPITTTNAGSYQGAQPTFILQGAGQQVSVLAFNLTAGTNVLAGIDTRAAGFSEIRNLTITQSNLATAADIFIGATRVHVHDCNFENGTNYITAILAGTASTNQSLGTNGTNIAFSGYVTAIDHCFFRDIGMALSGGPSANAIDFGPGNYVQNGVNNYLISLVGATTKLSSQNDIHDNKFEMIHYTNGVYLENQWGTLVINNQFFDVQPAPGTTTNLIIYGTNTINCMEVGNSSAVPLSGAFVQDLSGFRNVNAPDLSFTNNTSSYIPSGYHAQFFTVDNPAYGMSNAGHYVFTSPGSVSNGIQFPTSSTISESTTSSGRLQLSTQTMWLTAVNGISMIGPCILSNSIFGVLTNVLSQTANAWSTTTSTLNSGYTNLTYTNLEVNVTGVGVTVVFWNRAGQFGQTPAANPLWTNATQTAMHFSLPANCGFQVTAGTSVYAQAYAVP